MSPKTSQESDKAVPYSLIWSWLHLCNQRYGTMPTGEMQIALTIMLLTELGYDPTVTELADITRLAKSNVSRYVSAQMTAGYLEEYIDSSDRRRRKLRASQKAGPELIWFEKHVRKIYDLVHEQQQKDETTSRDFNILLENLRAITDRAITDATN